MADHFGKPILVGRSRRSGPGAIDTAEPEHVEAFSSAEAPTDRGTGR